MTEYIPGVCNIGPEEVKQRRGIGINWLIISSALLGFIYFLHLNPFFRLIIALPLIVSASGFYQAAFHFCAGYGNAGLYNVAKSVGKYESVEKAEFRRLDKKKAQRIFTLSIITAIIIAVFSYFLS